MVATKARYTGKDGAHHSGIPARDLTDDDWAALDAEQQAIVATSPAYRLSKSAKSDVPHPEETLAGATPSLVSADEQQTGEMAPDENTNS